jgi:hypothetical protein
MPQRLPEQKTLAIGGSTYSQTLDEGHAQVILKVQTVA